VGKKYLYSFMMESEEFKQFLFNLVACDYKEVSTETYSCHMLLWINKVKKMMQKLLSKS